MDYVASKSQGIEEKLKAVLAPCTFTCRLWFAGFRDACCLHRAYFFSVRSHKVFVKTGQCFLLNGLIFLGSIFFFQRVAVPILHWLLVFQTTEGQALAPGHTFFGTLQKILVGICYVFWLYPLYILSFVINCIWYNEIAEQAFEVLEKNEYKDTSEKQQPPSHQVSKTFHRRPSRRNGGVESIFLNIGEQIWSVVMLSVFFIEVFAVSFVPYIGQLLNFFLLSWLYAYYCFDYKWGFARWNLKRRLLFFETNWAFFAGFGSPCVLATIFFSPFVSYGVMAVLFPLFVLVATASNPAAVIASYSEGANNQALLGKLPLFYLPNMLMLLAVRFFEQVSMFILSRGRRTKHS